MSNSNESISTSQTVVAISSSIIGATLLILPRSVAEKIGTADAWMTPIFGGIIMLIPAIFSAKLSQRFPGRTFFQFGQDIVGKVLAGLFTMMFIVYFSALGAYEMRTLTEVIQFALLENTPRWAISLIFLCAQLYLLVGGINPVVRLLQALLPISLLFLFGALGLSFKVFDLNNLRPVFGEGIMPFLKGIQSMVLPFSGFESIMIVAAFIKQPQNAVKAVTLGVVVPTIVYTCTLIMVIGGLSIEGVAEKTWPTYSLIQSFEITGALFERFDILVLIIWVLQVFSTASLCHFYASLGISQLFGRKITHCIYGLAPLIFIASFLPHNLDELRKLGEWIGNAFLFLGVVLPIILFMISSIRRKPA
ncbi:spore gernimation protein [Brevibacillus fluminis]|uniref:Spore gernimation protein n=1 Tax=Brevibacillus fluminis TaxID=511487 RepID=A0A3M8DW71_9BACL|nr:GerAB/ArcD/ProY family transporter [Brevibacillus fluminis]RNB91759.1 spore gernimation protein [Brevibacillus fluminis]